MKTTNSKQKYTLWCNFESHLIKRTSQIKEKFSRKICPFPWATSVRAFCPCNALLSSSTSQLQMAQHLERSP